jgi:Galactose oxidase, central domain
MWTPSARSSLLAAALALAPSCGLFGSDGARLPLQLVTASCAGTPPLEGVTHLRLRVTGEGMEPLERLVPVGSPPDALEDVPAGPARVLEVRAYAGRPEAGGRVLSLGRTPAFDVAEGTEAPAVRVVLRRTNVFTPVSSADAPERCAGLASARAGHTATLLADGRVLLAGGFTLEGGGRVSLSSAELYSPAEGTLAAAPELASAAGPAPRAFHTANLLPSGRVLLAGGESRGTPLGDALLLEPAQGRYTALTLERPRSQHTAAVDAAGHVLLAGGVGEAGTVLAAAEGLLPEEGRSVPVALPLPRLGARALALPDGQTLAVVGGSDGTVLVTEAPLLRFEAGGFVSAGAPLRLAEGRRAPGVAPFGDGASALVLGGFDTPAEAPTLERTLATGEQLPLAAGAQALPGPNLEARADLCAVRRPDGRVLAVGGRTAVAGEAVRSSSAAELVVAPAARAGALPVVLGLPRLEVARWAHSCTLLPDGTVLVVGGLREELGAAGPVLEVLADALVFTPAPVD